MKQKTSLLRRANYGNIYGKNPVTLLEVSDIKHEFDSSAAASDFLGIHPAALAQYIKQKTKIIKSVKSGKLYLIKRISQP